ncbi:MAG: protein-glutamate O-methyltransferase CheR [Methylovulum sp.]|nr:protein-glutamate O-methyltransferase CheR [Methylovulum sp.]
MNGAQATMGGKEGYQRICEWLQIRSGITYQEKKKLLLVQRMQRVCETCGISGIDALADLIESNNNQDIQLKVLHAATTNHTYFFREPQVLDFFRDTILPTLPYNSGRIWSAAASTGNEAYTLAMIAAQTRGRDWAKNNLTILGTDISEVVIAHAEAGIYNASHVDQIPQSVLNGYFDPVGMGQYRVQDDLRRLCTFRRLNLKVSPYPFNKRFHAVFCRNVLYYFDREHQKDIVEAIYDVTEPGGWLLTSVTESLRDLETRWVPVQSGVYRKVP